ncbi:MAG: hypothetical protein WCP08_02560 [Prolixibacteraceae bacterium]
MFIKWIHSYIKNRLFQAYRKQHREVNIVNLKSAKSVGILWNPSDDESIETYETLRKTLNEKGIKSFGMAFISTRRGKETLTTVSNSWITDRSDVTFFGKPKSGDGIHFLQEEFDILIDLSLTKSIAMQYILIHSAAKFKVGWMADDPNLYDLEIDVKANPQCRFLMEQIVFYLEKLNENN